MMIMDVVLKELMKNPIVVDIVTKGVTNKTANYEAKAIDWDDGTRSELVYVPKTAGKGLHPIIIEFQYIVDKEYMKKQAGCCLKASEQFDIEPILLIICTNRIDDLKTTKHKRLPCYEAACSPWASKCYIISKTSARRHIVGVDQDDVSGEESTICELDPFVAFAIFITAQVQEQYDISVTLDHTLAILLRIAYHLRETLIDPNTRPVIKEEDIIDFDENFEYMVTSFGEDFNLNVYNKELHDAYVKRKRQKMNPKPTKKLMAWLNGEGDDMDKKNNPFYFKDRP